jgi:hypothetical protein
MIRIEKTGRHAIHFVFDAAGAEELARVFGGGRQSVTVCADKSLWKGRRAGHQSLREVTLEVVRDENRDLLITEPERLLLMLDSESIEVIAGRLRTAELQGFFPAEMAEVTLDNDRDQPVTLYGRLESESAHAQSLEERQD